MRVCPWKEDSREILSYIFCEKEIHVSVCFWIYRQRTKDKGVLMLLESHKEIIITNLPAPWAKKNPTINSVPVCHLHCSIW